MPGKSRKLVFLIAIVALNLLLLSSSAQGTISSIPCLITGTTTDVGTCIASAIPLGLIGIGISLFVVGLVYIAGEILNYRRLKSFYRNQLWETAKSAIIIALIFSILAVASSVAVSLTGQPNQAQSTGTGVGSLLTSNLASLYTATDTSYLQPQLTAAQATFGELISLSVGTDLLKSITLDLWFPIPIPAGEGGVVGAVDFGVNTNILTSSYITQLYGTPSLSVATAATDGVLGVLLILQVQHDLIYSIAALALGVLIPIGIIMRSIPFMRGIGGTMIAMGIGLSIVYPALLIGFNLPVTNYLFNITSTVGTQSTCSTGLSGLLCTLFNSGITLVSSATGFVTGTIPSSIAFGAQTGSNSAVAGSGFWTGLFGPFCITGGCTKSGIFPALNFVIDNTLGQLIQFVLFVIDLVMAFAISQGIARLLGGSIELGIGGRFSLA